jgi:hypothetical protein
LESIFYLRTIPAGQLFEALLPTTKSSHLPPVLHGFAMAIYQKTVEIVNLKNSRWNVRRRPTNDISKR